MNRHPTASARRRVTTLALALLAIAPAAAPPGVRADDRGHGRGGSFDDRHAHDRYYPERGHYFPALPPNPYLVRYHGYPYYYAGGAWYRPWGPRFVVVAPPVGVAVPFLPPYFTTVWFGGAPYYYADHVYYRWLPEQGSYVVTEPPGPPEAASTSQPDRADVYVYPARGQSEATQARDRYECHRWAADQTGFDPTQPLGGVSANEAGSRRADYQRAEAACLEARGYTVR